MTVQAARPTLVDGHGEDLGSTIGRELSPVRQALLADASTDAEQIIATARREGDEIVERAEREVRASIERARLLARATGRAHTTRQLARARRGAATEVLRAQEGLRRQLVVATRAAASQLPDDARYDVLLDRLVELAVAQLGPGALVDRDPAGGGVVATNGNRRVDFRLAVLADRALATIADEVTRLWT